MVRLLFSLLSPVALAASLWLSPARAVLARTAPAAALPPAVSIALARAQVPRDAMAVLVINADADADTDASADADSEAKSGGRVTPLLTWRARQPMHPASLMKLVTTYAALEQLGPAFVWRTPVYLDGAVREDGTLAGNLYLKGQGDPTLVLERLWLLLRRAQEHGVRAVDGDIVLDRDAFAMPPHDPGAFDGEPLRPYNTQPDALLVNFKSMRLGFTPDRAGALARVNLEPPLAGVRVSASVPLSREAAQCGDWRGALQADFSDPLRIRFAGGYPAACGERDWPVAYPEPARFAARAIAGLWAEMGGRLAGQVREGQVPEGLTPIFEQTSPPLAEVVRDINKFSNNVMAQQVFLTWSLQRNGQGSFEGARTLLRQWWQQRFGALEAPVTENGSGLSRSDRISALALARLLQAAWRSDVMPELAASLPVLGVDGTLRRSQARSAGAAHLKTGRLRDVAAVAGYVRGADGRRRVLVALINHPNASAAWPAIDALIDWTANGR